MSSSPDGAPASGRGDGGRTDVVAHPREPHEGSFASRLNWLRAGVLGANDGIVSIAGLVVGVAGAAADQQALLIAGIAGVVAGALSMAGGEYVSVSTQRDSERALIAKERWELEHMPDEELAELSQLYQAKGLAPETADEVARQLTEHDALGAHAEVELGIDPDDLTSPMAAALSSMIAFVLGALLPLGAIVFPSVSWRVPVTALAVTAALALTGAVSAHLGEARRLPAVLRTIGIGWLTMGLTWGVGVLVGPGLA